MQSTKPLNVGTSGYIRTNNLRPLQYVDGVGILTSKSLFSKKRNMGQLLLHCDTRTSDPGEAFQSCNVSCQCFRITVHLISIENHGSVSENGLGSWNNTLPTWGKSLFFGVNAQSVYVDALTCTPPELLNYNLLVWLSHSLNDSPGDCPQNVWSDI